MTEKTLDLARIREHWEKWAEAGTDVSATSKTATIKHLEIDAISRAFRLLGFADGKSRRVLEAGCGNGHNCVRLAQEFAGFSFHGFDYVPAMVDSARALAARHQVTDRCSFETGNLLEIDKLSGISVDYDAVFTVRAIINLNSEDLQKKALSECMKRVKAGGALMIAENFVDTYDRQNDARRALGLEPRVPASFNTFMVGKHLDAFCQAHGFNLVTVDDFGSLHDLILYVLLPATNGGTVDYSHPLVAAAAELSSEMYKKTPNCFGAFGQNRLYVYRKPV